MGINSHMIQIHPLLREVSGNSGPWSSEKVTSSQNIDYFCNVLEVSVRTVCEICGTTHLIDNGGHTELYLLSVTGGPGKRSQVLTQE